jgi:hypothetical protein
MEKNEYLGSVWEYGEEGRGGFWKEGGEEKRDKSFTIFERVTL